jgi:carbon-monoxide dehydrogenase small subunit
MKPITLVVNDSPVSALVEPRTQLADFLRQQLGLTGTHLGCEQGVCGACTVLIDGQPERSCIAFAVACDGREVRTVEGFDADPTMSRLREAFATHHALQCGFCTPGMLVTARDIVARLDAPDEARVRHELSGNLCRCTGYMGIVGAVQSVLEGGRQPLPVTSQDPPHALLRAGVRTPGAQVTGDASRPATQAVAAAAPDPTDLDGGDDSSGWSTIDNRIEMPHPADAVWTLLADPEDTVRCMPGAELTAVDGARVSGQMHIRFGPITAMMEGTAEQSVDAPAMRARLAGSGTDRASGTRVRFVTRYHVTSAGPQAAHVDLELRYRLAGPLAQFAREGLVRAFAQRYVATFGANMDAALKGAPMPTAVAPGVLATLARTLLERLRALFSKPS